MTLRAVAVAAGVVGDLAVLTGATAQDMAAQGRAAALLDGGHDLELADAQVAAVDPPIGRSVSLEDVGDFQCAARHDTLRWSQVLQWADDFPQDLGGDLGIEGGGLELLVAEQHLDDANIDLLFEQVRRKAVSEGMHRDAPVDLGCGRGGVDGAVELARGERIDGVLTGEQPAAGEDPAFGMGVPPPGAQLLEQDRREHGVAVLGPLPCSMRSTIRWLSMSLT